LHSQLSHIHNIVNFNICSDDTLNEDKFSPIGLAHAYSYQGQYETLPSIHNESCDLVLKGGVELLPEKFSYTSE